MQIDVNVHIFMDDDSQKQKQPIHGLERFCEEEPGKHRRREKNTENEGLRKSSYRFIDPKSVKPPMSGMGDGASRTVLVTDGRWITIGRYIPETDKWDTYGNSLDDVTGWALIVDCEQYQAHEQ